MLIRRPRAVLLVTVLSGSVIRAQTPLPEPMPVEPVTALIDALRTHDIVGLNQPHGNQQMQALVLSLVRDPRLPLAVQDIVLEHASARYQDAIDRYVRGEDVPEATLRLAWEDTVVPNNLGLQAQELIRAVRTLNQTQPADRQVRVLAGDPPIDWANVVTADDLRRWVELRDAYPADLIRRQVLDRGRRALVVYGQGHLQRAMIEANYDTGPWQAQTVMSLITRDPKIRVFNAFTLLRDGSALPELASSWPTPSLVVVKGTSLGARDFAIYQQAPLGGQRMAMRDGTIIPVPREQWIERPLEQQFEALLYLGSPKTFTNEAVPATLCRDQEALARRLQRLRFVPPIEAKRLQQACSAP